MKKFILCALLLVACITTLRAEQGEVREKVVTNKWAFQIGTAHYANHYLTNLEYSGVVFGLVGEHGAFYKRSKNVTWDLSISVLTTSTSLFFSENVLESASETTHVDVSSFSVQYGTHYNWNPARNFYLKAGGYFDMLLGMNMGGPNSINNAASVDLQPQIKASAGIKYGWNFKRFDLNLYADFALPVMGFMLVDSRYESALSGASGSEILPPVQKHMKFSSFHNLQGYQLEMGLDFVFRGLTFSLSHEQNNRWWNAYELQNYRKYSLFKVGLSVDLVSRTRLKSNNRYF